jgi:hypothetical protein
MSTVESAFAVLAEPSRRALLSVLSSSVSVGEMMEQLQLRAAFRVEASPRCCGTAGSWSHGEAQRPVYRLNPEPLQEVDAWLEPFRRF